jgi:hypothetical protein
VVAGVIAETRAQLQRHALEETVCRLTDAALTEAYKELESTHALFRELESTCRGMYRGIHDTFAHTEAYEELDVTEASYEAYAEYKERESTDACKEVESTCGTSASAAACLPLADSTQLPRISKSVTPPSTIILLLTSKTTGCLILIRIRIPL